METDRASTCPFSIAVVDDDTALASNLQDILEAQGYCAEICPTASAALARFSEKAFSLALVDIKLPDMHGLELVDRLARSSPQTEYLMVTGYGSFESAVEAVGRENVLGYEVKPLDLERLLVLVQQIRRRQEADARWRESESRLRLVMEQVPCIVWAADRELRFTYSAGAGLADLGMGPQEVIGQTVPAYFGSYQVNPSASTVTRAHDEALVGASSTFEIHLLGRTFSCRVEPLTEASGDVVGVAGVAFDITELAQTRSQLRALTTKLVKAQEEERQRIASELHDETGQSLTALRMMLDLCINSSPDAVVGTLTEARSLVDQLIAQMRDAMAQLRPPMLDDLGLLPTLLWDIDRFRTRTGVKVNFRHSGLRRQLPPELKVAAYRIVQECLTNAARHAGVSEVSLLAQADDDVLTLTVEDAGNGFDPNSVGSNCGGLTGMLQRAEMVGGTVEIDTSPGSGTRISVELPLRLQERETGGVSEE